MSVALPEARFFTGIDWAAAEHAACVMDAAGKIIAQFAVKHSAGGIASLVRRQARYGGPAGLPVAIERPCTAAHLGEHPDGQIFTSLPRPGQINAAQMLAEWGDCRQAYDGPDSVAALAGVTPVTKQSGKHRGAEFRWACNKRFRRAITTLAGNSRHASPWAAGVCNDARAAGKDHPHAIRILARAWIRVIWPCSINGVPYDPSKHGSAAALAEQTRSQFAA